jgi:hypothetical protein
LESFFRKTFDSIINLSQFGTEKGAEENGNTEGGRRTHPMTTKDKTALIIEGLTRICADVAALAAVQEDDVPQDAPVAEPAPAPEKIYTYEEARAILAEKSRTGFRAEVKAILTKHGVTQLSDVKDPQKLAAIVADVEEIQVG